MSSIARPSAAEFRRGGWIPASEKVLRDYILKLILLARKRRDGGETLLPKVQEFKDFIETDAVVFTGFIRMFEGATDPPTDYSELITMLNEIFREAPSFGSLGPPVYMVMAQNMNTQGGFSAYTKAILNQHFKEMFTTWVSYLNSEDSCSVLDDNEGGWFSAPALEALMLEYDGRTFAQVFICEPDEPHYGFKSFEDFFNRRYRAPEIDRPTGPIDDLSLISAPTESTIYAYQKYVHLSDELFIKDESYSLIHLLANDPYASEFVDGSVIQGFLNTTGYHRWHAPVNGTIKKIVDVPGTYFAQAPSTLGSKIPPPESDELPPYLKSLRYFANTATRQLIFIEADNTALGLVCFISIGMTEVSSCEATVRVGQHVLRGDELGMFHFGGSSSALVFRRAANVQVDATYSVPGAFLRINHPDRKSVV